MTVFKDEGLYLVFDTSGDDASIAVSRGPSVLSRAEVSGRGRQARGLIPAIGSALLGAGIDRSDISGVVVGEGPGSFTGVRVGAATAKGLVHGLGVPLWAVSSLAAAALSWPGHGVRYVLVDARGDRVYGACYEVGVRGVRELRAPHGGVLRDVLASDLPDGVVFCGDAAERHLPVVEAAGYSVVSEPAARPSADGLLTALTQMPGLRPEANPGAWEPRYIREWKPDASWRG